MDMKNFLAEVALRSAIGTIIAILLTVLLDFLGVRLK